MNRKCLCKNEVVVPAQIVFITVLSRIINSCLFDGVIENLIWLSCFMCYFDVNVLVTDRE